MMQFIEDHAWWCNMVSLFLAFWRPLAVCSIFEWLDGGAFKGAVVQTTCWPLLCLNSTCCAVQEVQAVQRRATNVHLKPCWNMPVLKCSNFFRCDVFDKKQHWNQSWEEIFSCLTWRFTPGLFGIGLLDEECHTGSAIWHKAKKLFQVSMLGMQIPVRERERRQKRTS